MQTFHSSYQSDLLTGWSNWVQVNNIKKFEQIKLLELRLFEVVRLNQRLFARYALTLSASLMCSVMLYRYPVDELFWLGASGSRLFAVMFFGLAVLGLCAVWLVYKTSVKNPLSLSSVTLELSYATWETVPIFGYYETQANGINWFVQGKEKRAGRYYVYLIAPEMLYENTALIKRLARAHQLRMRVATSALMISIGLLAMVGLSCTIS